MTGWQVAALVVVAYLAGHGDVLQVSAVRFGLTLRRRRRGLDGYILVRRDLYESLERRARIARAEIAEPDESQADAAWRKAQEATLLRESQLRAAERLARRRDDGEDGA